MPEEPKDYQWWKYHQVESLTFDDIPLIPITRREADVFYYAQVFGEQPRGSYRHIVVRMQVIDKPYGEQTGLEGYLMFDVPLGETTEYTTGKRVTTYPQEVVDLYKKIMSLKYQRRQEMIGEEQYAR